MDFYKEILPDTLSKQCCHVLFPNLTVDAMEIVQLTACQALKNIKSILEDDSLNDPECFLKIEEIVRVYESIGSDCGIRHDFG